MIDVTLRKGSVFVWQAQKRPGGHFNRKGVRVGDPQKTTVFMVDYLCDMGAFSTSIFTHAYIGFNILK